MKNKLKFGYYQNSNNIDSTHTHRALVLTRHTKATTAFANTFYHEHMLPDFITELRIKSIIAFR